SLRPMSTTNPSPRLLNTCRRSLRRQRSSEEPVMSVNRRFVLKGMALGSAAALTLGGSAQALAGIASAPAGSAPATPALVLVSGGSAEADFLHGAGTALGSQMHVQRVGSDLAFVMD